MKSEKIPVNFQSLARFAKVSKAWLYKQPELCEKIKTLRDQSETIKRVKDTYIDLKMKDEKIAELTLKLNQKNDIIKKLKKQIEIVYGELHKQNREQ